MTIPTHDFIMFRVGCFTKNFSHENGHAHRMNSVSGMRAEITPFFANCNRGNPTLRMALITAVRSWRFASRLARFHSRSGPAHIPEKKRPRDQRGLDGGISAPARRL